jgi:chitinase
MTVLLVCVTTLFGSCPSPASSADSATAAPSATKRVVLSFAPFYRPNLRRIPLRRLTHLVYAFAEYGPDDRVRARPEDTGFAKNVAYLRSRRRVLPELRVLLGLGGAGEWSSFFARIAEPERRDAAARDAVQFMVANGFDGIDIDWEFPRPGTSEPDNFVAYMAALRRAMDFLGRENGRHYVLSTDVGFLVEDPFNPPAKDETPPAAAGSVDLWNVMAYSMRGAWNCFGGNGGTGHAAALRPRAGDPYARNGGAVAVAAWRRLGVPAQKIVLGIPFYGTLFEGVAPGSRGDGLGQACTGSPARQIDAPEIRSLGAVAGFEEHYDRASEAAYRYDPAGRRFLSFENVRSIAAKRRYAQRQGLAGVMSWDLGSDDAQFTLLRALSGVPR